MRIFMAKFCASDNNAWQDESKIGVAAQKNFIWLRRQQPEIFEASSLSLKSCVQWVAISVNDLVAGMEFSC